MSDIAPFYPIEFALRELIRTYAGSMNVGTDLSFDAEDPDPYYWIGLVPGGSAGQTEGSWTVDIDVFSTNYLQAMSLALVLEAKLMRGYHLNEYIRIDSTYQNTGPHEVPWDDDVTHRISATYVFTARRPTPAADDGPLVDD